MNIVIKLTHTDIADLLEGLDEGSTEEECLKALSVLIEDAYEDIDSEDTHEGKALRGVLHSIFPNIRLIGIDIDY